MIIPNTYSNLPQRPRNLEVDMISEIDTRNRLYQHQKTELFSPILAVCFARWSGVGENVGDDFSPTSHTPPPPRFLPAMFNLGDGNCGSATHNHLGVQLPRPWRCIPHTPQAGAAETSPSVLDFHFVPDFFTLPAHSHSTATCILRSA